MPYRPRADASEPSSAVVGDTDLLPVAIVLWAASVALCALRIARREPLDGDGAVAALCCVALPWAFLRRIKKT
jgi:hypothetical protein